MEIKHYIKFFLFLFLIPSVFAEGIEDVGYSELSAWVDYEENNYTCSATKIYEVDYYLGCLIVVDGHTKFITPNGLTEFGCDTYCEALGSTTPVIINHSEYLQ